jgi:hypothetical protein
VKREFVAREKTKIGKKTVAKTQPRAVRKTKAA